MSGAIAQVDHGKLADHRWQKGQSGNPAGVSKKRRLEFALRRKLKSIEDRDAYIEAGMAAIREHAPGWQTIYKEFLDRYDGPIPQVIELEVSAAKVVDLGPVEIVAEVVANKVLELKAGEDESEHRAERA